MHIHLMTFSTSFTLSFKPHLIAYVGSHITIEQLATPSAFLTPTTFPFSNNI